MEFESNRTFSQDGQCYYFIHTYPPTHWPITTYLLTYLSTHPPTYLPTYYNIPTYPPNNLFITTNQPTYLPTYLPIHPPIYFFITTCPPTHPPTYLLVPTHPPTLLDAPPSFLMDSTVSPKVTIVEGQGVRARSLARNTLGVEEHVEAPGWGLGRWQESQLLAQTCTKPNNKFVNV
jgi:hypothetical protein